MAARPSAAAPSSPGSASSTTASTSPASSTPGSARKTPSDESCSKCGSPECRCSTTCAPSDQLLLDPSMSSPAASPARAPRASGSARDLATPKPFCGARCSGPFASFDRDSSSSRTWRKFSASMMEPSGERFAETWPRSGSISRGTAYRLRPSAPLTAVIGSSALLPTPMAADGERQSDSFGRGNPTLKGALKLLPTPRASERHARAATREEAVGRGESLPSVVVKLLPTPHGMPKEDQKRRPGPSGNELGRALGALSTGGSTDLPSSAGKLSTDRYLSPWFVEWMMGAPEGWSDPACRLSATEFRSRWASSPASTSSSASESE
jgi:hypothetical protein